MTTFISNSIFLKIFFFFLLFSCFTVSQLDKARYNEALKKTQRGEVIEAKKIYEELLKRNPNYNKARYNLVLLLIGEKKWREVNKELEILKARMPENVRLGKLRAFSLFSEGFEKESLELYKELILRLPMDREVLYNLAYLLWRVNQNKTEAIFYLNRLKAAGGEVQIKDKIWIQELGI